MAFDLHPDSEVIHRGVRVTVRTAELRADEGQTHRREVVEAADAVVVLPLMDNGDVVLIRNKRFAVRDTLWELPAGTVEPGESPDGCAPRELEEETGYRARQIEKLAEFFPTPGFCTELLHAYLATGLEFVGQRLDETEKITAQVVAWDEAMRMVRDNTIRDAKTIATLLYHQTFGGAEE
ncbi:MAG: NUDIX hydrolase [Planctomycetota bacterium]